MSRLTGSDALELMEAYQEVYKPKELSVDEVWEEVENWVNSLLEEGYDLSEYTWEDMYESYLNEDSSIIQRQSFDLFDVIMGHLIDEGYAEDEKSASVIIANMSEEWKESIINEGFKRMNRRKIEKQAQRLDKHGDDRGDILRNVAARMDKESERKFSTDAARKNRKQSGESETYSKYLCI